MAHIYGGQRNSSHPAFTENDARFRRFMDDSPEGSAAGECTPPMDVLESADAVEILMDVPGVGPGTIRLMFSQGTLVVAGRKVPAVCAHREAAFHLAERSFGRFVRAIRLTGALDAGRASATLSAGVLRIVLPRIEERRGREIRIDVTQI